MNKRKKSILIIFSIIAVLLGAGVLVSRSANRGASSTSSRPTTVLGETVKAKATVNVEKWFEFKGINQKRENKTVKFTIYTLEKKDQIKVQGEARQAPRGYDFLLVRTELDNKHSEKVAITPSDLIRMQDETQKLYAPDYHNGSIILEPLSVKKDLMSFIIKEDAKKFTFLIGELSGEKEKVEINF